MDTKDTRVSNLLFLLSAAPIGLGCVITSDDGDTGAGPTTATPTTTEGETDTPTTGTPTTDAMTSGATGDTTEGPADTTEGPADTTEGPADTTGEPVSEACEAYADHIAECYEDPRAGAAALNYCLELVPYYEAYGPDCVAANEDYLACLTALDCAEVGNPDACGDEFLAVEAACGG